MDIRREIDHLVRDLCDRVAREEGYLTSIRVTRPPGVSEHELKAMLTERLADAGLDFVDLFIDAGDDEVRLVGLAFEGPASPNGRPRLLLALDLTEPYDALVGLARAWAERVDGVLSMVFAGMYADVSALFIDRKLHDLMKEELRRLREGDHKRLKAVLDALPARNRGRAYLVDKPTVPGILDLAENYDAILVGTHGRRGLPRLGLGSVAERLARLAPTSVVVLRTTPVRERRPG